MQLISILKKTIKQNYKLGRQRFLVLLKENCSVKKYKVLIKVSNLKGKTVVKRA